MELPAHYKQVLAEIDKTAQERSRSAMERAQEVQKAYAKELEILHRRTNEYILTGIADFTHYAGYNISLACPHVGGWGSRTFNWRQYFKQLAADMHRPYVHMAYTGWWDKEKGVLQTIRCHITVPNRRYCDILLSTFMLYPAEIVTHKCCTTARSIHVKVTNAKEIVEPWREMCAKDRRYRDALRLP